MLGFVLYPHVYWCWVETRPPGGENSSLFSRRWSLKLPHRTSAAQWTLTWWSPPQGGYLRSRVWTNIWIDFQVLSCLNLLDVLHSACQWSGNNQGCFLSQSSSSLFSGLFLSRPRSRLFQRPRAGSPIFSPTATSSPPISQASRPRSPLESELWVQQLSLIVGGFICVSLWFLLIWDQILQKTWRPPCFQLVLLPLVAKHEWMNKHLSSSVEMKPGEVTCR